MDKTISYFNSNLKYLRYILDITMATMADEVSKFFDGTLSAQQIQSYESSSEPKFVVLVGIWKFLKTHDDDITLDMLITRDFASEKYQFVAGEKTESTHKENAYLQARVKKLEEENSKLLTGLIQSQAAHMHNSENIKILISKTT